MDFPRTLLLTSWAPDARYAGAENLRRVLAALPADRVCWCGLRRIKDGEGPLRRAFPIRDVHWRLKGSLFEYLYVHEWQARSLAEQVARGVADFNPQVLWVLPELAAIPVAIHLARMLRLPIHATVYDSLESARELCLPAAYYPRYMSQVRRLFGMITSFDTVSAGLRDHVMRTYGCRPDTTGIVFPPSVPASWMTGEERKVKNPDRMNRIDGMDSGHSVDAVKNSQLRRIAFCGAMRCSPTQWQGFLDRLSALPYQFEFHAYAWRDSVPQAALPGNVRIDYQDYVEKEEELVRRLQNGDYDACYLALWDEPEKRLFARTSLSCKLATYAAAGLPVIYDGPEDSAAWPLIGKFGAGIRIQSVAICNGSREDAKNAKTSLPFDVGGSVPCRDHSKTALASLFFDSVAWQAMALGCRRMCREVFNLNVNVMKLHEQFCRLTGEAASC